MYIYIYTCHPTVEDDGERHEEVQEVADADLTLIDE